MAVRMPTSVCGQQASHYDLHPNIDLTKFKRTCDVKDNMCKQNVLTLALAIDSNSTNELLIIHASEPAIFYNLPSCFDEGVLEQHSSNPVHCQKQLHELQKYNSRQECAKVYRPSPGRKL